MHSGALSGQLRPDLLPVVGAQLWAGHGPSGFALDRNSQSRSAWALAIAHVSKVPGARVTTQGECFAGRLIGQRLQESPQVHALITPFGVGQCQHRSVSCPVSTLGMAPNPLKELRSLNLRKLNLSAKELAEHGRNYSYWQGLLNGSRPFAEKTARSIEDDLGLARGWLDQPNPEVAEAASPFRDLSADEAALVQIYRQIGAIAGREAQDAVAYEMNKTLSRANAASSKPTATPADPFPGKRRPPKVITDEPQPRLSAAKRIVK